MYALQVCGVHQSGKTTTVKELIKYLKKIGKSVASIKDIHLKGFQLDPPNRNTYVHKMARPQRCRLISFKPIFDYFKPRGIPLTELKEINLTLFVQSPVKIAFVYIDSLINQSYISSNTSLSLPDYVYNISILFNNSILELNDINTTENENITLRIEQVSKEGFLKVLAFDVKANFSTGIVKINYSDTNYTKEEYLSVYKCDSWNFSMKKCMLRKPGRKNLTISGFKVTS